MNVKVLKEEKNDIELEIDNLTVAEILRIYLNDSEIEFAAWRREHPSKPAVFKIVSSGKSVQKVVSEAVSGIKKDCDSLLKAVKKK